MNLTQKIFVLLGVGSVILFIIGAEISIARHIDFGDFDKMFKIGQRGESPKTNWLAIISAFNIVVSFTGFFLFKDK
jgi:hypothetical protein